MAEQSDQPTLRKTQTSTLEIAYEESGSSGTPVLLLHGFPYDPRQFDAARDLLVQQNFRVYVPYLRGYGQTRYLHERTMRSGQQAILAKDVLEFMDALGIPKAILAGYDWGGRAACIIAALYPDRVIGLLSCAGYGIQNIPKAAATPAPPDQLRRHWYQYYFHTEQGRQGLEQNRNEICKFLWQTWSPNWKFSNEEFARSAQSFANEDFVPTVLQSYRHRYANVAGDPEVEHWERQLADQPSIGVPTFVLAGASDGVEPPNQEDTTRDKFTGPYTRKLLPDAGHCPPVEDPREFAAAIQWLASQ